MTLDYETFLAQKHPTVEAYGKAIHPSLISENLHDWQRDVVRWALWRGRAALFEECGLGKTRQQLEWAGQVADITGERVLVVAPLAVAHQTIEEGTRWLGMDVRYVRSQAEADAISGTCDVFITNYDMLKEFDGQRWSGVVLDESSILKSFTGSTKRRIIEMFQDTPYRLACTATPAPNDHLELGNHAEFLGVMPSNEMIMRWFINDTMAAGSYRLKKHAEADYWRWVTSWAVCISKPSDLGPQYSDDGYNLPALTIHQHELELAVEEAYARGQMVATGNLSATNLWRDKKKTFIERCQMARSIVDQAPDETYIIWCDTNDEADALVTLFPDAVEVRGSHTIVAKESRLKAFSTGDARIIITKPEIAAFGLNWQHCGTHIFVGITYSFEKWYQAIRRSLRFGRVDPVTAHIIHSESEGNVIATLHSKQEAHRIMQDAMTTAMKEHGLFRDDQSTALSKVQTDCTSGKNWTMYLGDCVATTRQLPDESVDFSIFSPPFSNLYIYSDSEADMGNAENDAEFFKHFGYLVPELLRVTRAGRLCAVHCKDLPRYMGRDGAAGLFDFPGELIRVFEASGWQFHSRVTIWKDPVIEMQRTKNHGLLHKNFAERAEVTRQGMADYLIVFRKWAADMPDGQVKQRRVPGDYIGECPPVAWRNDRDYSIQVWQRYASPVWFDIDQTDVLNYQLAKDNADEKHICPLQLGVIRKAIDLWTEKGDVVFSPFGGIGSEPTVAVQMGRYGIGVELKPSYYKIAVKNLQQAELESGQQSLFDLLAA